MSVRFLSLFSGIEAASAAWAQLGWECVAVAEVEPFPCALLAQHFPDVPNLGDVTKITDEQVAALGHIDVVVGGSPCQDLSVAGKRAGLGGERSSLFHHQVRIFNAARTFCGATALVWENVPGVFSSNDGRDFAVVVGTLIGAELSVPPEGWGNSGAAVGPLGLVEWSCLDSQFFGVPQRRNRVFVVLDTGDWASRPPLLLEPGSLLGDSPPSRKTGEEVAGTIGGASQSGGFRTTDLDNSGAFIEDASPIDCTPEGIAGNVSSKWAKGSGGPAGDERYNLIAFDTTQVTSPSNYSEPKPGDPCHPLAESAHPPTIAFEATPLLEVDKGRRNTDRDGLGVGQAGDPMFTLQAGAQHGVLLEPVAFEPRHFTRDNKTGGAPGGTVALNAESLKKAGDAAPVVAFESRYARVVPPLKAQSGQSGKGDAAPLVAFNWQNGGGYGNANPGLGVTEDGTGPLSCSQVPAVGGPGAGPQVRRLTPLECVRLQGFPDDWLSDVTYKGKRPPADGVMYKAVGNSMAVPVMLWIGQRMQDILFSAGAPPAPAEAREGQGEQS